MKDYPDINFGYAFCSENRGLLWWNTGKNKRFAELHITTNLRPYTATQSTNNNAMNIMFRHQCDQSPYAK
jgi:hypothetical protein